jgi:PAS domain S-box-containing protein
VLNRVPVLGTFDHRLCLEMVSFNVEEELGHRPLELLGSPLSEIVHPDDNDDLRDLVARAAGDRVGSRSPLRLRHGAGRWQLVEASVAYLAAERPRFGLSLTCEDADQGSEHRLAYLEQRLHRIGQEVAAAGLVRFVASPELPPGFDQLPEKQREVLARLLEGERVSGIAKRMFLSPSTVRNHLCALYRRYGVSCQEELLELFRARRGTPERGGLPGEDHRSSL